MNISEITKKYGFGFSKKFGQNFIGDEGLLKAIVDDAEVCENDVVLEIGAGAGTLTREIAKRAKRVVSFEIDRDLEPILSDVLRDCDNVEIVYDDVTKWSDEEIADVVGGRFKIVANLPYYITTPLLFKFLCGKFDLVSATLMVQKEVAERICAAPGTRDYGALTVSVGIRGKARLKRIVGREKFTPAPNVDSAIVRVDTERKYDPDTLVALDALIRGAFAMKRKTLVNNIRSAYGMSATKARDVLAEAGLSASVRAEEVDEDGFMRLCAAIREGRTDK